MHARIADFAHRHRLSAAAASELDQLFAQRSTVTVFLEGFTPVNLDLRATEDAEDSVVTATSEMDEESEEYQEDEAYQEDEEEPQAQEEPEETTQEPRIAERYEDLGPIGFGAMGEVRKVRDLELNRTVAMKLLHAPLLQRPGALDRFLEEVQTTAQLQHPNILAVHDVGRLADGRIWFTMELVRGRTLGDIVREVHEAVRENRWEPGPTGWTFRRLMTAFLVVCRAVGYAHERGVLHRNLKPENAMFGENGEVMVLDWGLAKVVGRRYSHDSSLPVSPAEGAAGSAAYRPPEQARGKSDKVDARSDVYALGAMLYEILSRRPPYEGPSAGDVLAQVVAGPPALPGPAAESALSGPPMPWELVAVCQRAMERQPGDRFPSAGELAQAVEAWLDGARPIHPSA